jgi:predicted amidohydrolase YtcJ
VGFAFLEDENMDATQVERRKMVTLPQDEFEAILERAAERGARHALHEVGLDGEDAAHDIRELRNLLDAFNEAKKTAGLTIIKMMVTGFVMVLLAGTVLKLKVFGGTP